MERPKDIKFVSPEHMLFLQDYWETFGSERGKRVLKDLQNKYCNFSLFDENPHKTGYLVGRSDVVKDIEEVLNMRDQVIQVEEEVQNG